MVKKSASYLANFLRTKPIVIATSTMRRGTSLRLPIRRCQQAIGEPMPLQWRNLHLLCLVALFCAVLVTACQPIQPAHPSAPSLAKRAPGGPTVAFVQERSLYIHPGDAAVTVEDCTNGCHVYYLTWSPDGERLAYFYSPVTVQASFAIRLTNLRGQVQTVATHVGWITPPAWSPQGERLAYLVATDRYVVQDDVPRYLLEVWTSAVLADGTITDRRKHGEVSIGGDCGGGGRSESAALYETEGGLAYGGYLAGILAWSAEDLLLYSNHCSGRGVGRFDLTTGTELEPYPGKLGSLSLNRTRDGWVAVDEQQQLVVGNPAELDYTPVSTKAVPELAFYSQMSNDIFYTTLTVTGTADLFDGSSAYQQTIPVSPYFEFTQPTLRRLSRSSSEAVLWEDHAYAYARLQQAADGTLYFARVGSSEPLYHAYQAETLSAETLLALRPSVDVLRLRPGEESPAVWLVNASQFTLAPATLPVALLDRAE